MRANDGSAKALGNKDGEKWMDWRHGMWSQLAEWVQWWREGRQQGACAGFQLTWKVEGVTLY